MSGRAGKRPLRSLSAHEKLEAIHRVHDGESKASVARDIGVPESTLRGWCKNEDKISYLSRQSSSPDTDESLEAHSHHKKAKPNDSSMQPFNLSLKNNNGYSPNSEGGRYDAAAKPDQDQTKTPLNLQVKTDATPKASSRPKNKEELARMTVLLGLNTEEKFVPTPQNPASLNHLTTNMNVVARWNTFLAQQQQQQHKLQYAGKSSRTVPAVDPAAYAASLLVAAEQEKNGPYHLPSEKQDRTEAIKYWLEDQRSKQGGIRNAPATTVSSSQVPVSNVTSDAFLKGFPGVNENTIWLLNWYREACEANLRAPQPAHTPDKPILYHQLTRTSPQRDGNDQQNAENLMVGDSKNAVPEVKTPNGKTAPVNGTTKGRLVLDNLLSQNNIIAAQNGNGDVTREEGSCSKEEDIAKRSEALEHGVQFLKWLEDCSDPSVTTIQLNQFKTLLNNVRSGIERKKSELEHKTKVRKQ